MPPTTPSRWTALTTSGPEEAPVCANPRPDRWGLLGVAAPLTLVVAAIVFGGLQPRYSHVSQAVSELAACGASYQLPAQVLMLGVYGATMAAFAWPLHRAFASIAGWKPAVLVALAGLLIVVAAAFPCDPGCGMTRMSTAASVHMISAMLAFGCMIAAPLVLGASFTESPAERILLRFSRVMAALTILAYLALMIGGPQSPWMGAYQRCFLLANGIWMAGVGIFIWRAPKLDDARPLGVEA